MSLKITNTDLQETNKVAGLIQKIDQIDGVYLQSICDEMFKFQPFMLSVMLGYRFDVPAQDMDEIIKLYCLVWEYFKGKKNIKEHQLTEEMFEKAIKRNVDFFKYLDGEGYANDFMNTTTSDLEHIKSKALLTGIFYRWNTHPGIVKMEDQIKSDLLIGLKSIIEGLEELLRK
jgi:hypothetical protein